MKKKAGQKTEKSMEPKKKEFVAMTVVNPNAAGIDVGDTIHAVAVPADRDSESVRVFGAMSCDLEEIAAWLSKCGIDTVAMESTGVYWKPLFSYLVSRGFEVYLVNAAHVRNVSGRKTDMSDAAWLQKLHTCGLLQSSYLPDGVQESLRNLVRYRKTLCEESSRFVLRMEKALEMMNVKLHTVISDLTGKTGTAIVQAILGGERDAKKFLPLVDGRIKASADDIEKSLQGHWREDQLFLLGEHYESYQYFQSRIASCDRAIEEQLKQYAAMRQEGELSGSDAKSESVTVIKKKNKNAPSFDVHGYMLLVYGVNILAIYGISEINALQILAEVGTDMSKWKTAKHFVSWLNLCPNNKISGGKVISSRLASKKPNAASQAFRMAANAIQRSDNWLGDYFRRMKAKGGNKYAIVATANKLATIFYRMVSEQVEFNPVDMTEYREKQKLAKIAYLERRLEALKQQTA